MGNTTTTESSNAYNFRDAMLKSKLTQQEIHAYNNLNNYMTKHIDEAKSNFISTNYDLENLHDKMSSDLKKIELKISKCTKKKDIAKLKMGMYAHKNAHYDIMVSLIKDLRKSIADARDTYMYNNDELELNAYNEAIADAYKAVLKDNKLAEFDIEDQYKIELASLYNNLILTGSYSTDDPAYVRFSDAIYEPGSNAEKFQKEVLKTYKMNVEYENSKLTNADFLRKDLNDIPLNYSNNDLDGYIEFADSFEKTNDSLITHIQQKRDMLTKTNIEQKAEQKI